MENNSIYSYSKLTCFEQCELQYFKRYILKEEQRDSVYGLAGTSTHEAVESVQSGKFTNEEALEKWRKEMDFYSFLGYDFTTKKTELNFVNSIEHFIKNYKVIPGDVEIEKEVEFEIEGYKLRGFIDLLVKDGNHVKIYDLKTSTIYKKKDIPHYKRQLVLYALALESMGFIVDEVGWIFMKYCVVDGKRGKKTILRNELESGQEFSDCYLTYKLDEKTKEDTKKWIVNTIEEIESKDDLFDEWRMCEGNDFYCSNLCSFCDTCEKGMEIRKRYRK